jgi:hypothetical protein
MGLVGSVSVCLLWRGVGVSSVFDSTRRRRRRGVGVSSVFDSTRLRRRRRGVGVSSLDVAGRSLTVGLASGWGLRRLRVGRSDWVGVVGTTIGTGAGAPIVLSLLGGVDWGLVEVPSVPLWPGVGMPNGGVDPGEGVAPDDGVDSVVGAGEGATATWVTLNL